MLRMMAALDVNDRDVRHIRNPYYQQKAAVRMGYEVTETVEIKREVRQGCMLSPVLFVGKL